MPSLHARALRANATDAERKLWRHIRQQQLGARFRRQVPIGPFIADFCCLEQRLIIEVDGGQHEIANDAARTQYLEGHGFRVIRSWNNEVLQNIEGVLTRILEHLTGGAPPP